MDPVGRGPAQNRKRPWTGNEEALLLLLWLLLLLFLISLFFYLFLLGRFFITTATLHTGCIWEMDLALRGSLSNIFTRNVCCSRSCSLGGRMVHICFYIHFLILCYMYYSTDITLYIYLFIYRSLLPFTVLPVELSKCEGSSLTCHVTAPMTYRCQRRFQSVRIVRFAPFIIFSQQLYLFFYLRCLCVWYFAHLLFPNCFEYETLVALIVLRFNPPPLVRSSSSLSKVTMSAVLRCRPDGPALRRLTPISNRFVTSRNPVFAGLGSCRALHGIRRRPAPQSLPRCQAFSPALSIRFKSGEVPSAAPQPVRRSSALNVVYKGFAYCGFFIISSSMAIVAFFVYDATTYRDDSSAEDIPVSELALNPPSGGPKNLPIAEVFVGDNDSERMMEQKDKPRLVILGTGWGSVALLKHLNPEDYHVTVVSPTNYFLFTPMLPSATVGTLGLRSLVEPVRRIIQRVHGHFLKAEAVDVEFSDKLVEVSRVDPNNGTKHNFYLPYDKLVIGVGMFLI